MSDDSEYNFDGSRKKSPKVEKGDSRKVLDAEIKNTKVSKKKVR